MQFNKDIDALAQQNAYFRQEVVTGLHCQVVLMSLPPGGEIGEETHPDVDQVLVFVSGEGKAILNGEQVPLQQIACALSRPGQPTTSSILARVTSSCTPCMRRRNMRLAPFIGPKLKPTLPSMHNDSFSCSTTQHGKEQNNAACT